MSTQNKRTHVIDTFGNSWVVRRRVDSGYGFDLLYGVPLEAANQMRPSHHILNDELRQFIEPRLKEFVWFDIPITPKRRARLKRIVSSLRYKSVDEWLEKREKNDIVLWVDPDYISLPELTNIDGQVFEPSAITVTNCGLLIWNGIPGKASEGKRHRMTQYVFTPELESFLSTHKMASLTSLQKELFPISIPIITRFLRQIASRQAPNLQSWKEAKSPSPHMHHKYFKDSEITDALGRRYKITSINKTPSNLILLRGRPVTAGLQHRNGHEVVITPELAAMFEEHQYKGGIKALSEKLNIGPDAIMRVRKDLGLRMLRKDCKKNLVD